MLIGISMVKDEDDIIEATIQHLFDQGVDHLIVADNLSTDRTPEILRSFGKRISVVLDGEPGYYQSIKMTLLAHRAGRIGADWVIPFDADEFWSGIPNLLTTDAAVALADTTAHLPSGRTEAKPLPKVAFRYNPAIRIAQGNHSVTGVPGPVEHLLHIDEYQYRTWEQFKRKVRNGKAAYDATDLPATEGAHWRTLGALSDAELELAWKEMQ